MIIEPGTWEHDILSWMKPAWTEYNLVEIQGTTWAATDMVVLYLAERKSQIIAGYYAISEFDHRYEMVKQSKHSKFPDWDKCVDGDWTAGEFIALNNRGRSRHKFYHDIVSKMPEGLSLGAIPYEEAIAGMGDGLIHAQISIDIDGNIPVLIYPDERDRQAHIMPMLVVESNE